MPSTYALRIPDSIKFVASLKACAKQKDLDKGTSIHDDILKSGLPRNCYIASALVNMYAKCGAFAKAAEVLNEFPVQDVVPWNALLAGYAQQGQGEEALKYFEQMQHKGLSPNAVTFTCILKACGNIGANDKGEKIHEEIVRRGFLAKDILLGSALVDMYVKCGAFAKAVHVLDDLPIRNVVAWNALIAGYIQQGKAVEALKCFGQMLKEDLTPNSVTYLCALKACGIIGALDKGKGIHEEIIRGGLLQKDVALGTALLDMYFRCGAHGQAAEILNELPVHDIVSWNALIARYVEQGLAVKALEYFDMMQNQGFCPNSVTFICIVKACGSLKALGKGEQIHEEAIRQDLIGKYVELGTSLVDMYAKCGALSKAVQVFSELPHHDVISWSALIAGYAQQGQGKAALMCVEEMQCEGFSPTPVTFICILNACGNIGVADEGEQIHSKIISQGVFGNEIALGNALVGMYAKCGALTKAVHVLDKLLVRNVVTWTAVITGYAQHGQGAEALKWFERMQDEGFSPDSVTFIAGLMSCGSIMALDKGELIHKDIARQGLLAKDIMLGTALVDMYAKCGALCKAAQVFYELPVRDVVSWNSLLAGYVKYGQDEEAMMVITRMQIEGFIPDAVSFMLILKVCGRVGAVVKGGQIHKEIVKQGLLGTNVMLETALADMYAKCDALAKAAVMLEKLGARDVVSWNTLIAGHVQEDQGDQALLSFERMQTERISPNAVTFTCILKACAIIGAAEKVEQIHMEIIRYGLLGIDRVLGDTLVEMYAKCGATSKAAWVLEELPVRDVVSWNALISGYSLKGHSEEVLGCIEQMHCEGVWPDRFTFAYMLSAYCRARLVDEGWSCFTNMCVTYRIMPNVEHLIWMVDLLGHAGQYKHALQVIKTMPSTGNVDIWHALLGACSECENANLGELAFFNVVQIDKNVAAAYIRMSKIYVAACVNGHKRSSNSET